MDKGYWWCAKCKQEVDQADVTYSGLHVHCGKAVKWVDSIYDEVVELRAKLAAAEKERDEERAHNAVLRGALKESLLLFDYGTDYCIGGNPHISDSALDDAKALESKINQALSETPSDSAERVKGLVDALEWIIVAGTDYQSIGKARQALAEWRGE